MLSIPRNKSFVCVVLHRYIYVLKLYSEDIFCAATRPGFFFDVCSMGEYQLRVLYHVWFSNWFQIYYWRNVKIYIKADRKKKKSPSIVIYVFIVLLLFMYYISIIYLMYIYYSFIIHLLFIFNLFIIHLRYETRNKIYVASLLFVMHIKNVMIL